MGLALLAHIGIPLLFGLAFVIFSAAAIKGPMTWDLAIETALDLAILSIGAIGALFENPKLTGSFGGSEAALLVGIAVIAVNLVLSAILILMKRRAADTQAGPISGIGALFIGAATIAIVTYVVSIGYHGGAPPETTMHQIDSGKMGGTGVTK